MSTAMHDSDFYAWTQRQAELLRAGQLSEVDVEHLIEELEGMGISQRNQLVSRLRVLIGHLLKWQYQPHLRGRSWEATIKEQRYSIQRLLEQNPSLQGQQDELVMDGYRLGVLLAVKETNLEESKFPEQNPYAWEQILDDNFWPE
jgi:hypothetical protein